ncbi:MAG: hypothetical protein GXO55_11055 [Chloroflexi bacterium]|nr:hypothetical protein [Chloroflexota bacterium]
MRRTTPRHRPRGAPWASLFFFVLLLLFLGITLYATTLIYHEVRTAVVMVGEKLHIPISPPDVSEVWGQAPEQPQTPPAAAIGGTAPTPVLPPTPNIGRVPQAQRVNILLLGVDRRPQETGPPRTDTLILLSIDMKTGDTSMLSLPRDLWVEIPPYRIHAKLNQAYAIGEARGYPGGGIALVKDTVSAFVGYPVHHYALVDFDGFRKLIDLIGGIEVCVPKTIHDERYPTDDYGVETLHIEAGCQHMDGDLALKYARTRHADSDYGRARRQQQVILAARDKIMQARMLPTLLVRAPQILRNLSGSLETDIPLDRLVTLARLATKISPESIRQAVIDSRYGEETYASNGAWILLPDMKKLYPLFDVLLAPQVHTQDVKGLRKLLENRPTQDLAIRAENARLLLLNGTRMPGEGEAYTRWLLQQGFFVGQFGEAAHTYAHTWLLIQNDRPKTREALIALYHIQPAYVRTGQNFLGDVDMALIVGNDAPKPK